MFCSFAPSMKFTHVLLFCIQYENSDICFLLFCTWYEYSDMFVLLFLHTTYEIRTCLFHSFPQENGGIGHVKNKKFCAACNSSQRLLIIIPWHHQCWSKDGSEWELVVGYDGVGIVIRWARRGFSCCLVLTQGFQRIFPQTFKDFAARWNWLNSNSLLLVWVNPSVEHRLNPKVDTPSVLDCSRLTSRQVNMHSNPAKSENLISQFCTLFHRLHSMHSNLQHPSRSWVTS
jgi:hypothetical protein